MEQRCVECEEETKEGQELIVGELLLFYKDLIRIGDDDDYGILLIIITLQLTTGVVETFKDEDRSLH